MTLQEYKDKLATLNFQQLAHECGYTDGTQFSDVVAIEDLMIEKIAASNAPDSVILFAGQRVYDGIRYACGILAANDTDHLDSPMVYVDNRRSEVLMGAFALWRFATTNKAALIDNKPEPKAETQKTTAKASTKSKSK